MVVSYATPFVKCADCGKPGMYPEIQFIESLPKTGKGRCLCQACLAKSPKSDYVRLSNPLPQHHRPAPVHPEQAQEHDQENKGQDRTGDKAGIAVGQEPLEHQPAKVKDKQND